MDGMASRAGGASEEGGAKPQGKRTVEENTQVLEMREAADFVRDLQPTGHEGRARDELDKAKEGEWKRERVGEGDLERPE